MIAAVSTLDAELVESYKDCSGKMSEITEAARIEIERCVALSLPVPFPLQGVLSPKRIEEWQGWVGVEGKSYDIRLGPEQLLQERARFRDAEAQELLFFDSTVRGMFQVNSR